MSPPSTIPPGVLPRATRRGFLRLAGATAALTALGQLRMLPPVAAAASHGERFFDAGETEILTRIAERMVYSGDPAAPRVRDTATIATIDALCAGLPPAVSEPLPLALRLFEYGPFLFDLSFARFTRMSDAAQDTSLHGWMTSRFALRRLAFTGLRNLCMLGYYSQPETRPLIGYRGPLIGTRPTP